MINLEGVVSANWRDLPAKEIFPGVRMRNLWQGTNEAKAKILEIDPGVHDGVHDYPAGTFIHNPADSAHVPQSKEGCVIFVFFPEG